MKDAIYYSIIHRKAPAKEQPAGSGSKKGFKILGYSILVVALIFAFEVWQIKKSARAFVVGFDQVILKERILAPLDQLTKSGPNDKKLILKQEPLNKADATVPPKN